MGATIVTGTILGVDNAPQVGVYVTFRLKGVGTDSVATSTIDQDSISSPATDSNGDFSVTLWDNGDSGIESILEIRMPSGQRIDVIIPAGDAAIDIWDLIENYHVGTAAPQLPTNEALFIRKANNLSDVASASTSRTNLGVAIGSDIQAFDSVLSATTASFLIADETKLDGIEALAEVNDATTVLDADIGVNVQAFDATIMVDADIGTTVQAHDSKLDDVAALTPTDGNFLVGNGTTWVAESGNTANISLGVQTSGGGGQVGASSFSTFGGASGNSAVTTSGGASGWLAISTDGFAGGAFATANGTGRVQLGTGTNNTNSTIQFLSSGSVTATEFGYMAGAENQAAGLTSNDTTYATSAAISDAISTASSASNQGKQGIRSVTFPTTSDFLSAADHASLDVGTGDFSIFFAARIDSDSGTESIIYKYGGGIGYQVRFVSGALQLIMNDGVGDTFTLATGMSDDKWHVYVITVDRSGNATAYIDGVAQTPADVTSAGLTLDNAGKVQIGVNASSNPLDSGAMASYVGLTKDLITAAEVGDTLFDATRLKDLSDLSLCVDMGSLVDVFTDRSSNAHTITVNGSPTYNDDRGDFTVPNATIIVRTASDLSGTLSSDKVYLIDGIIDMGTQTITVPAGGLEINGFGVNVSKLTSTENSYTMFVDAASDAGNLFISNIDIDVSGTTSKVFDLDNSGASGAVEINVVNFTNCTSLGTLDAYRQFLMLNSFWLSCADGLTFAGAWAGGAKIETFLVRNFGSSGTVFTGSTSPALTFASRFLCNGNIDIPSGSTVYDFAASMFTNDADFELITGSYTGAGTIIAVKSPVIDNTSAKSRHRDNNGLDNTYIGGRWRLSSTSATSTGDTNFYKVAGTTVASDLQWMSAGTANDLTYDSTEAANVEIKGTISFTSAGNSQDITLKLRQYDDSAAGYVDLDTMPVVTTDSGSGKAQNVAVLGYAVLNENDRVELWVSNASSASITVQINSILSVTERAN